MKYGDTFIASVIWNKLHIGRENYFGQKSWPTQSYVFHYDEFIHWLNDAWSIHDIFALNALLTDMNRTVEHRLTPADRVDRRRRRVIAFLHAKGG